MAEITIEKKNKISHRNIAVKKLGDYLNELLKKEILNYEYKLLPKS